MASKPARHRTVVRTKAQKPCKRILLLGAIRLDFQPPENLFEEVVREYVDRIRDGKKIRPIRVRFDGTSYFCEDGFHRIEATRRTGNDKIEATVRPGGLKQMEAEFKEYLDKLKKKIQLSARS